METVVFLVGLFVSAFAFPFEELDSINNCTVNEFSCANGNCVPQNLRCDNSDDCGDGSDENACDLKPCDDAFNFRCKNMMCISNSSLCNGEDDCGDSSDEQNCPSEVSEPLTCQSGEWQCLDKKSCIPLEKVCNGELDCSDQSDEVTGCSTKIVCDGFTCNNGDCIPREWVCDGQNDCSDKSDEQNCTNPAKIPASQPLNENTKNSLDGEVADQGSVDKFLSICTKRGEMEMKQVEELHNVRMQVEAENLRAAKLRVKVAELQVQIEEAKLEAEKLEN